MKAFAFLVWMVLSCFLLHGAEARDYLAIGHKPVPETVRALRTFILSRMKETGVPGCSVALLCDGRIVWAEGLGIANIRTGKTVDQDTIFATCSCSKPVSTLAVLKFAEQGKINLDAPIEELVTTWKPPENHWHAPVTPRLILSHRAGLSIAGAPGYPRTKMVATKRSDLTEKLRILFEPGTRYQYSGGGFMVLEVVLEDLTGKPFEQVMDDEVLRPMGMQTATFSPYLPEHEKRLATGHKKDGQLMDPEYTTGKSAAWLHANARDMARFLIALRDASERETPTIVKPSTVKMMFTPAWPKGESEGNYVGLGIMISDDEHGRHVYHTGSNRGYKCVMRIYLKSGDGIVVLTNSDNGAQLWNAVCDWLYAR
ncbi:MAG TPA: hypothetical protein DD670_05695 [Planctomycetaceae bacterium]|nr:hypothetical protein [Planctomycetaceae bacterium]